MYLKNKSEYSNSRFINYNRWSTRKEVDALVSKLVANIGSRKKAGYKCALKVLLLDLYQSYVVDPEQYVGYFRDMSHYHFRIKAGDDDRYIINPHITYKFLVGSIEMLVDAGLLHSKTGSHFADEVMGDYGYISKMRATPELISLFIEYKFSADMIYKFKQEEVIIQKDFPVIEKVKSRITGKYKNVKKKYEFNYIDDKVSKRLRSVVLAYNSQLDDTYIDCDAECLDDADKVKLIDTLRDYSKEPIIRIDLSNKNVYRVFNNRSFEQGGRFYGAWWHGCPSILRKYITINDEPTVELDYSGIHIQLLYAMKGINYAAREEDAYTIDDGLPDRKLNKLILLTAINAETEKGARDSVYNQLRQQGKLKDYDFKRKKAPITDKLALLKAKHSEIADCIATGEGVKLQYLDSCIIEKLILYGIRSNIPMLTVHDSVICQTKYADLIMDKMWQYYADMLNNKLNCDIKYTKFVPHAGSVIRLLAKQTKYTPIHNYTGADKLYNRYSVASGTITQLTKSDIMIKVEPDARSNTCNGSCKHSDRATRFINGERNYPGAIKLELVHEGDTYTLKVK